MVSNTLNATNTLKSLIATGQLKPNDIIDIGKISSNHHLKDNHVAEAIATLENEGFVTYSSKGPIVRKINKEEILIWLQKRFSTELDIVKKLAKEFDGKKAEVIEKSLKEQEKTVKSNNVIRFLELNADFHYHLAMLAGYPTAAYWFKLESVRLKISEIKALDTKSKFQSCFQEHVAIVDALKKKDSDMARNAMKIHLEKTEERITA